MIHALKYSCNKIRTKQAKINPIKVLNCFGKKVRFKVAFEIVYILICSSSGREFHSLGGATGNALPPNVFFVIPFGMQRSL